MPCGNTRLSFWKQDEDVKQAHSEKKEHPLKEPVVKVKLDLPKEEPKKQEVVLDYDPTQGIPGHVPQNRNW